MWHPSAMHLIIKRKTTDYTDIAYLRLINMHINNNNNNNGKKIYMFMLIQKWPYSSHTKRVVAIALAAPSGNKGSNSLRTDYRQLPSLLLAFRSKFSTNGSIQPSWTGRFTCWAALPISKQCQQNQDLCSTRIWKKLSLVTVSFLRGFQPMYQSQL